MKSFWHISPVKQNQTSFRCLYTSKFDQSGLDLPTMQQHPQRYGRRAFCTPFHRLCLLFRAAMVVSRNPNLQEIWDVQRHPNVTVMKGSIQFLDNAKLCRSVIGDFMTHVHIASGKEPIISDATNGYLAICTCGMFQ